MRSTAELSEVSDVMAGCWLWAPEWTRKPGEETRNNKINFPNCEINYFVLLHDFPLHRDEYIFKTYFYSLV